MAKGIKTGGRAAGTPNKATSAVKEALISAFEGVGGIESLKTWAMDNQTEFYKLWVKVLPQEVNNNISGNLSINNILGELDGRTSGLPSAEE